MSQEISNTIKIVHKRFQKLLVTYASTETTYLRLLSENLEPNLENLPSSLQIKWLLSWQLENYFDITSISTPTIPKVQWQSVLMQNIFTDISSFSTDSEEFQNQQCSGFWILLNQNKIKGKCSVFFWIRR